MTLSPPLNDALAIALTKPGRERAARAPPGVYNNCSVGHGNQIIAVPRAARSPSRQSQCSNTHFVTIAARSSSSYLDVKTKGGSEGGVLNPNVGSRVPINTYSDVQISSLRVNCWVPLNGQNVRTAAHRVWQPLHNYSLLAASKGRCRVRCDELQALFSAIKIAVARSGDGVEWSEADGAGKGLTFRMA